MLFCDARIEVFTTTWQAWRKTIVVGEGRDHATLVKGQHPAIQITHREARPVVRFECLEGKIHF